MRKSATLRAKPARRRPTSLERLRSELAGAARRAFALGIADHAAGRFYRSVEDLVALLRLSPRAAKAIVTNGPDVIPSSWALHQAYVAGNAVASARPGGADADTGPAPSATRERWERLANWSPT